MPWSGPSSAKIIPMRPLDKGMIRDRPSQVIPDGAFTELRNFIGNQEGPHRRPGFTLIGGGEQCPYNILDQVTVWSTTGSQISILITEKTLWKLGLSGIIEVVMTTENTGTVAVAGLTVTGTGTTWLSSDILPGDLLRIGTEEALVATVDSDTQITLEAATITDDTGLSYSIVATHSPGLIPIPDSVVYANNLIIADGKRPLISYDVDTDTIDYWISTYPSTGEFISCAVTGFNDRIFVGYLDDATDGIVRQRIRWSNLADKHDFSTVTNYLDLPYVSGELQKLVPLGQVLIAYFTDGVFVGTPTNYPTLPVQFDMSETGGVGLVGKKAVCSYLGGHFWVGQDDIYMTTSGGTERIGSPITKLSVRACQYPELIYTTGDPANFTMCFGMPEDQDFISQIWRYDYRCGAWSHDEIDATMIANPMMQLTLAWDDLPGTMDEIDTVYPTWDSMNADDPRRYLYRALNGYIYKLSLDGDADAGTPIEAELITKDHDFNELDGLKTFVRFGIKIESNVIISSNIVFNAYVSINRGRVWKSVGQLTIRAGYDEGYVNFRAIGSTCRFRLVTQSAVESYYISEYTMRVRLSGGELDVSTQT